MHTDIGLARKAVTRIVHEPRRAAASSPGVDLGCVLRHAVAAHDRQRRRDVALLLLLILIVVTLPLTFGASLILGLLAGWALVAAELVTAHYHVAARQLKRENFDPRQAPRPPTAKDAARLQAIELRDRGNVVISSRYEPFVGHGVIYRTWSFALNTGRPESGKHVIPFTVHELNTYLSARGRGAQAARYEHRRRTPGQRSRPADRSRRPHARRGAAQHGRTTRGAGLGRAPSRTARGRQGPGTPLSGDPGRRVERRTRQHPVPEVRAALRR
ncbi:hypothetical protein [Streptomyces echinatus]|uniref:hypothetical protein n=1 Tax=Streptomyces echinatus TaxID=67293 RepID=UPI0031F1AD74